MVGRAITRRRGARAEAGLLPDPSLWRPRSPAASSSSCSRAGEAETGGAPAPPPPTTDRRQAGRGDRRHASRRLRDPGRRGRADRLGATVDDRARRPRRRAARRGRPRRLASSAPSRRSVRTGSRSTWSPAGGESSRDRGPALGMWPAGDPIPRRRRHSALGRRCRRRRHGGRRRSRTGSRSSATAFTRPCRPARPARSARSRGRAGRAGTRCACTRCTRVGPRPRPSTPTGCGGWSTLERAACRAAWTARATLARELAAGARDDPFAGCLAGYVLLRLGLHEELDDLAAAIVEVAPRLSDAYILRGEREAAAGKTETRGQAFADAVNAGSPPSARVSRGSSRASAHGLQPPARLARAAYLPAARARLDVVGVHAAQRARAGRLVITGADIGFEG